MQMRVEMLMIVASLDSPCSSTMHAEWRLCDGVKLNYLLFFALYLCSFYIVDGVVDASRDVHDVYSQS